MRNSPKPVDDNDLTSTIALPRKAATAIVPARGWLSATVTARIAYALWKAL